MDFCERLSHYVTTHRVRGERGVCGGCLCWERRIRGGGFFGEIGDCTILERVDPQKPGVRGAIRALFLEIKSCDGILPTRGHTF